MECPWRRSPGDPDAGKLRGEDEEPAEHREGRPGGRRSPRCGVKGRESVPRTDDGAQAQRPRPGGGPLHLPAWQDGARRVGGDARLKWAGGGTKGLQTPLPGAQKRGSGWRGHGLEAPCHLFTVTARAQHRARGQGLGRWPPRDRRKGGPGVAVLGGSWACGRGSPLLGASVSSVKEEAEPCCWGRKLEVRGEERSSCLPRRESVPETWQG